MNWVLKLLFISILFTSSVIADEIDKSMNIIENTNTKLKSYQNRIDNLDEKTQELFSEYKYTNAELKNSRIYNNQLRKILDSQKKS